jgi:16S rRNA (guanine1207-N2)-methyltransferase
MARRKKDELRQVPAALRERVRPPVGIVLGSPHEVAHLVDSLALPQVVCFQMDLYPAGRIRESLGEKVRVETGADLWDLPAECQTLIYLPALGGERELKIDMIEQAFHGLQPGGSLVVWSPYKDDSFFPAQLKKVFGKTHAYMSDSGSVLVCHRNGDRPRRRHEVTFQNKVGEGESCRFLSRPGTFSYGRFDSGARALMETAQIAPGQRVLDLGCGCGTNGIFAWQRCGPDGHVTFVDSNLRALALTEHNARANDVAHFDVVATPRVEGLPAASFDVILANPPYFAQSAIARLFVERGKELLSPEGKFYLVTKQPNETATLMAETFGNLEAFECRGYVILSA